MGSFFIFKEFFGNSHGGEHPKEPASTAPRYVASNRQEATADKQEVGVNRGPTHFIGLIMKTFSAKPAEVMREWFVIDVTDKVLGRVASEIARRLRGKHKPEFTPHVDTGDYIIIINGAKLKVTGAKQTSKKYYRHTGYPGGIYETTFDKMQEHFPGRALKKAVKGMLPKGPLGYAMIKKLKVYADGNHPHEAQQPKSLEI